jgi:hypothetical protein
MNPADPEMEKMLANPEFLAEPVFSRDLYLAQVANGLFGHLLRLAKVPPEAFKQVQQAHADSNSICMKLGTLVAWTYELEAKGPSGQSGSDLFIARAKLPQPGAASAPSPQIREHLIGRRVLRIQVESPKHPPTKEYQICDIKNIGWYGAALVLPNQRPPGNAQRETPEQKKNWWKFW